MASDLAKQEGGQLAPMPRAESTTEQLIRVALDKGMDPKELYAILREERAINAKAAFNAALGRFQRECPPIPRRHRSQFDAVNAAGVKGPRMYADLEDIATAIAATLADCGLSYRWGGAQVEDGLLFAPCIIAHDAGHSEISSVPVPVEMNAGCSPAQKYGIAHTYARRYSLVAGLGLTSVDVDADGADPATAARITEDQANDLNDRLIECGADVAAFKKFMGVDSIADIRVSDLAKAIDAVDRKRKAKKA